VTVLPTMEMHSRMNAGERSICGVTSCARMWFQPSPGGSWPTALKAATT
jgi:hypothetical protein